MSLRARLTVVGATAITLEAVLGMTLLVAYGPIRIALFLLVCALATSVVVALMWHLLGLPPRDDPPGGGGIHPEPPPPPWWPEFEREFRDHVRERERSGV